MQETPGLRGLLSLRLFVVAGSVTDCENDESDKTERRKHHASLNELRDVARVAVAADKVSVSHVSSYSLIAGRE